MAPIPELHTMDGAMDDDYPENDAMSFDNAIPEPLSSPDGQTDATDPDDTASEEGRWRRMLHEHGWCETVRTWWTQAFIPWWTQMFIPWWHTLTPKADEVPDSSMYFAWSRRPDDVEDEPGRTRAKRAVFGGEDPEATERIPLIVAGRRVHVLVVFAAFIVLAVILACVVKIFF